MSVNALSGAGSTRPLCCEQRNDPQVLIRQIGITTERAEITEEIRWLDSA
jgi:hypothetical protein